MEKIEAEDSKLGVLNYEIKDHQYVVDIRWKDGKESQHNFPEKGFGVYKDGYEASRHGKPPFIEGKEALEILKKYSSTMNEEDFSWLDYVNQGERKGD